MADSVMENGISFETQMAELEGLVRRLEQGDLPLEEALQAFETGSKLVKACREQLAKVEMKIETVINAQGDTAEV